MGWKFGRARVAGCLLFYSSVAWSQSTASPPALTPQNAQRFLAGVLTRTQIVDHRLGTMSMAWISEARFQAPENASLWADEMRKLLLDSFAGQEEDVCVSTMQLSVGSVASGPHVRRAPAREAETFAVRWDWRGVRSARVAGSSVIVSTIEPPFRVWPSVRVSTRNEVEFQLSDEGMAARVGYAMEFLRLHCDPVANTGF